MFDEAVDGLEELLEVVGGRRRELRVSGERASDGQVEAALAVAERLRRAADGLALTVIEEVDRRGDERGADGLYRSRRLEVGRVADMAPDVVAVATGAGPYEAGTRCDLAARVAADLPELGDLLVEGVIREATVARVERQTRDLAPETTAAVLEHLLAPVRGKPGTRRIAELEPREIDRACRRVIDRVEPEVLAARARHNRTEGLGVRTEPGPVGTTHLSATLPSEIGAAIHAAVEAAAAQRLADQPGLTKGAARALGLADLTLRGVDVTAHVRLGVPIITSAASRLAFAPTGGGEPVCPHGGMGPVDCSCFGPAGAGGRNGPAPAGGGEELPAAFGGPDPAAPAQAVGADGTAEESHLVALDGTPAPAGGGRRSRAVTGMDADEVDVLAEEWAGPGIRTQAATTFGPGGPVGWISGATIPGIGYVPPDVVAAITSRLDTRISRALLDARTGTLVETSNPRYTIPEAMREFVTTREGVCRMWGCQRPVHTTRTGWGADLDHAKPWPEGATAPGNLSALCRHHHRVKHADRWGHQLHPDGTATWTTPGGRAAFTYPDHVDATEDDATGTEPGASTTSPFPPPSPGANDEPTRDPVPAGPPPF